MTAVFGETRSLKPTQKTPATRRSRPLTANRTGRSATWFRPGFSSIPELNPAPRSRTNHHQNLTNQSSPGKDFWTRTVCIASNQQNFEDGTAGSFFTLGSFCHGAINQERRKMLSSFIEVSVCFFQPVRIVTFEGRFHFIDQCMNLPLIRWFDLIANKCQRAADRGQQFVALQNCFGPETFGHVFKGVIQRLRDHFFHSLVGYVNGTAQFNHIFPSRSSITC